MIVVMKPNAAEENIRAVVNYIEQSGLSVHKSF